VLCYSDASFLQVTILLGTNSIIAYWTFQEIVPVASIGTPWGLSHLEFRGALDGGGDMQDSRADNS
jgi:hypothetical protein